MSVEFDLVSETIDACDRLHGYIDELDHPALVAELRGIDSNAAREALATLAANYEARGRALLGESGSGHWAGECPECHADEPEHEEGCTILAAISEPAWT